VVEAGQFLLVATAVIENTRVMKILMDGGSGINILYKDAFNKLNMDIRKLHASQSPFHGIIPGWRVMPLGTIDLSMTFSDAVHYKRRHSPLKSSTSKDLTAPYSGGRATPSSWLSQTTPTSS
jgi:hypothetical protein